jgi:uncharacterized protein YjiS (DUF1127 family)
MTDAVFHPTSAAGGAVRVRQLVALLSRAFRRALLAEATRRALEDLPDNVRKDIGLRRRDIPRGPAARFLPRVF